MINQDMQWQPIATAPKDWTAILVYYEKAGVDFVHIAFWDDGDMWEHQGFASQDEVTGWWSYVENSVSQHKLDGYDEPTHWMPFEAPPKVSTANAIP